MTLMLGLIFKVSVSNFLPVYALENSTSPIGCVGARSWISYSDTRAPTLRLVAFNTCQGSIPINAGALNIRCGEGVAVLLGIGVPLGMEMSDSIFGFCPPSPRTHEVLLRPGESIELEEPLDSMFLYADESRSIVVWCVETGVPGRLRPVCGIARPKGLPIAGD
jgi:hypothetical protein